MSTPPTPHSPRPQLRAQRATFRRFVRSFGYAAAGVVTLVRVTPNARVHLAATVLVIALAAWLEIDALRWAILAVCIGLVWVAEAINTAIEAAVDLAMPERHPLAKRAKDVAAGAVLIAAMISVVVGLLVFGPALATGASN